VRPSPRDPDEIWGAYVVMVKQEMVMTRPEACGKSSPAEMVEGRGDEGTGPR
jgi:hypothetical protein